MTNRYAIVDQNGNVINVCNWDGQSYWLPPDGCVAIESDIAQIGGTYVNGAFSSPPQPQPSDQQLLNNFLSEVRLKLFKTDATMLRIQEAISNNMTTSTTADVVAYVEYRKSLRGLLKLDSPQSFPSQPPYPAGT